MIFYKRSLSRSIVRKILNIFDSDSENTFSLSFFRMLKFIAFFIPIFIIILYFLYLFLFPYFINEKSTEDIVNSYFLKNTKFSFDIDNLKVKPGYKFDINIKADSIKVQYPDKTEFLHCKDLNADLNLINLLFKKLDLTKIKFSSIVTNLVFKDDKYTLFNYFDLPDSQNEFNMKNFKLITNEFKVNLYDAKINKIFNILSGKTEVNYSDSGNKYRNIKVLTSGKIDTKGFYFGDYNVNSEIKLTDEQLKDVIVSLSKMDFNPLRYALNYKFNFKSDVDLKVNLANKNKMYEGKIALSDFSFLVNNIQLPKNSAALIFKSNKIYSDFDFNFVKDQFVKINFKADVSKNKSIEAKIKSNELNLDELNDTLIAICKILNLKDFINIKLSGKFGVDIFLKSDFKTIQSNGKLNIVNVNLYDKKNNIKLDKINMFVDFSNNKIAIKNSDMYLDKARLNMQGTIDDKTNLDIKIASDKFNVSDFVKLAKTIPLLSVFIPEINNYDIKSGLLSLNVDIKGNLAKPLLEINSSIEDFKVLIVSAKSELYSKLIKLKSNSIDELDNDIDITVFESKFRDIKIPKLELNLNKDKIVIKNSKAYIDVIPFEFEGYIQNYLTNPVSAVSVNATVLKNNKYFRINSNSDYKLKTNIEVKNNDILINDFKILADNKEAVTLSGMVQNILEINDVTFKKLKIDIKDKINLTLKQFDNLTFELKGDLEVSDKINSPKINGNLNLLNINYSPLGVVIPDLVLNINNSSFYLNVVNSSILNQPFEAVVQGGYQNKKIVLNNLYFSSSAINYDKIVSYLELIKKNINFVEIKQFKANIFNFYIFNANLSDVAIEGSIKNNILLVNKFDLKAFKGEVSGNAEINLNNFNGNFDILLKEISTRHFLSEINELKDISVAVSGKLSSLIQVKTNLENFEFDNFIKNSDVYSKFNINDGELSQFAKLERLLQAGNILSQSILKLNLNSIISAVSNRNTGDFKTIEGTIKIKNGIADVQYIKTQGTNMSLYMTGKYSFYNEILKLDIFGRIPKTIVNVMGNAGKFSTQQLVNKMPDDTRDAINSITKSPFEKMMSTEIEKEKLNKIPPLAYSVDDTETREFMAVLNGRTTDKNAIKYFKWNLEENGD